MLTTREAAASLGIGMRRLQQLLDAGKVPGATRFGRLWQIPEKALKHVVVYGKPGKPSTKDRA